MARKSKDGGAGETVAEMTLVPDVEHPDFQDGRFDELTGFTPNPDAPPLPPFPPQPLPFEPRLPLNPRLPLPERYPYPPLNICTAVSGRYRQVPPPVVGPAIPRPGPLGTVPTVPFRPLNLTSMTVRVDVDRFFPQNRISVEVTRLFPSRRCHVIAEVTSDQCTGFNRRRIEA